MFLLWRNSDAAQAEAIYVSNVSIPTLLMRSPQTAVQQISDLGDADLEMRSVQKVNIQEKLADAIDNDEGSLQTTKHLNLFLFIVMLVCDASTHKCRDLNDSPGHASSVLLRLSSVVALSHKCRDLSESPGQA